MTFYDRKVEDVLSELNTDPRRGLCADEVCRRKEKYGENKLREKKRKNLISRFAEQFKDVMILILLVAAAISFFVVCFEKNWGEIFEPLLIVFIVILNAGMGVYQEGKAEKALDALKNLSAPHAKVIRDGCEFCVNASDLVPGDIIKLEAGDLIPADARLIKSFGLKCEESALTGESVPTEKDYEAVLNFGSALGDRKNTVYSGCIVVNGTAEACVTATGMDTEMGKIADLLNCEKDSRTPLQNKLSELGKYLGIIALAACAVVFVVGLASGIPALEIFMTAVSLAVSAIPEGLPAIVTIVLSVGVQRMVKKNALIRKLPAVETLGSASVICSDKTGTLTQNRMTLTEIYVDGSDSEYVDGEISEAAKNLLTWAALCCNGSVDYKNGEERAVGDPTETAIISAAYKNGLNKAELNEKFLRVFEIPFDSDRKLMTTVNIINGKKYVIVKGAFDILEKCCIKGDMEKARDINEKMSGKALRVLGVAYKEAEDNFCDYSSDKLENSLIFMGLVGMIDPPRPEVKEAVSICQKAGIKPVMITGDHLFTASAIARDIGIMKEGDLAVTGAELDDMSDCEFSEKVEKIAVYARVSPENKIRIVKAWQNKGKVVSMTGDGVNDAPALKAADIGCAMGITGTDVAKGAADMTLTDDNFATIVDAVCEGRGIYDNIKKVVGFLLGTNMGEIITVFVSMLLWRKSPLLSMQLLWINLVTDSLPAIALGMEPIEPDIKERQPKPKAEGLFSNGFGIRIIFQGIMFGVLTLFGFRIGESVTGTVEGGRTMAFAVLSLSQIVQAFNMRSDKSLFKIGIFKNRMLNKAVLISVLLVAVVMFTPLNGIFGLVILPAKLYIVMICLICVPLIITELFKVLGIIKQKK